MPEHRARIVWRHTGGHFGYETYSRDHTWAFPNGTLIEASSAPAFLGSQQRVDPEEAFVAAVSSCHMLTFLAVAARQRLVVESYVDEAVGRLAKNGCGRLAVTEVDLRPRVVFAGDNRPSPEAVAKLHEVAHRECFIANSVRTLIRVLDVVEAGVEGA